jgi:hypothetical protein
MRFCAAQARSVAYHSSGPQQRPLVKLYNIRLPDRMCIAADRQIFASLIRDNKNTGQD